MDLAKERSGTAVLIPADVFQPSRIASWHTASNFAARHDHTGAPLLFGSGHGGHAGPHFGAGGSVAVGVPGAVRRARYSRADPTRPGGGASPARRSDHA